MNLQIKFLNQKKIYYPFITKNFLYFKLNNIEYVIYEKIIIKEKGCNNIDTIEKIFNKIKFFDLILSIDLMKKIILKDIKKNKVE